MKDPDALKDAMEYLTCAPSSDEETWCLRHGYPFTSEWPCEEAKRLAERFNVTYHKGWVAGYTLGFKAAHEAIANVAEIAESLIEVD